MKSLREMLEDDSLEVGDLVDVDTEYMGVIPVRVLKFVDDVRVQVGMPADEDLGPGYEHFHGPGFVGEIESDYESGTMVFSLGQIVKGSKEKHHFPKDINDMGDVETYTDRFGEGKVMKITEKQLRNLIKEEVEKMQEVSGDETVDMTGELSDALLTAVDMTVREEWDQLLKILVRNLDSAMREQPLHPARHEEVDDVAEDVVNKVFAMINQEGSELKALLKVAMIREMRNVMG